MLNVSELSYTYSNSEFKLENIHCQLSPGEILSVVGPSGSGKSSFFKLLSGILTPDLGTIELGSKTYFDASKKNLHTPLAKRDIGIVFQTPVLFPHLDIRDNLLLALENQRDLSTRKQKMNHIQETLELLEIGDFISFKPHELSGGQQQRVCIARALLLKRSLCLFDEPFGHLDQIIRQRIRAIIKQLLKKNNQMAIFITHDPQEAIELSDQMLVLNKGQIAQYGDTQAIITKPSNETVANIFSTGLVFHQKSYEQLEKFRNKLLHLSSAISNREKPSLHIPYSSIQIGSEGVFPVMIINKWRNAHQFHYDLQCQDHSIIRSFPSQKEYQLHQSLCLNFSAEDIQIIDPV
jgi:ABC-type Fe3+/spermidine/putrescine transport system ATPase subunit